jgi:hypothetical protein
LKNATVVTVLTNLIVSGILVAATTIPVTAQGPSSSSGADATPFLHLAKMHLMEATKDIKAHNSQAALTQLNMTHQTITLAGLKLNTTIICNNMKTTIICNNMKNEGYCEAPMLQFLK